MAAKNSVLRWAIGSLNGPRSSTWRLWGNKKGDIYVAVRILGGIVKASFHRDGKCQVGFTAEYTETATRRFAIKSRHWETWRLPTESVVRVLQVIVPHSELRPFVDSDSISDLHWLPTPPEGSVAVASIVLSPVKAELEIPSGDRSGMIIGLVQTSIRTAWLIYAHNPIDAEMAKIIAGEHETIRHLPEADGCPSGTRAALWESRSDHDRHVLELACD